MVKSQIYSSSPEIEKTTTDHALQLFDDIIRPVKSARFLGVEIDNLLSFNKHIDLIQSKTTKRLNVLKVLARHGVEPKILIKLYKIYVRPISEYGSASFVATSTTQLDRLQRIQNDAIRVSLKLPKYIRTELLHEYASLEPIRDRLLSMNSVLLNRMTAHNDHVKTLSDKKSSDSGRTPIDVIQGYKTKK